MHHMNQHYKGRFIKLKKIENCYYTYTKTEDFLIDWTDEHENILIVSPCSGHGFKFSPLLGKIVADLLKYDKSIELFEQNRYLMRLFYHLGVNLE
jgi:glycine/D-amino acid oxidase-like deaminating enzyme